MKLNNSEICLSQENKEPSSLGSIFYSRYVRQFYDFSESISKLFRFELIVIFQ